MYTDNEKVTKLIKLSGRQLLSLAYNKQVEFCAVIHQIVPIRFIISKRCNKPIT